jgi:hypothetical protein
LRQSAQLQVDARFQDINRQVLAVDEIRQQRAQFAEQQAAEQVAEGNEAIAAIVDAAVGRGDDAEQVTEYAKQIFEQAGRVQWEASADDKRALFAAAVEVARDGLRQESQIRSVLGRGPYPGGSWVKP